MQYSKWLGRAFTIFVGATTIGACAEEAAEFDVDAINQEVDAGDTNMDLARVIQADAGSLADAGEQPAVDAGEQPLDPHFSKVYELITQSCVSCHGAGKTLDLSSPALAHGELVGVAAEYKACATDGGVAQIRVIANAPGESLLMAKLENRQSCGKQMPTMTLLPAEQVEAFRVWIASGAKLH